MINLNTSIDSRYDVDTAITHLTEVINDAFLMSVPNKTVNSNPNPADSSNKMLIRVINYFRRKFQKTRSPLAKTVSKKLFILKNLLLQDKLSKIKTGNNNLWKLTKCFTKKPSFIPLMTTNNSVIYKNKDKANLLANYFQQVHVQNDNFSSNYHVTNSRFN